MKYLAQTFSYLKKNCWLPMLVMLVPAIASCFLYTPFWEVSFVASYDLGAYPRMPISRIFIIIFGDSWRYLWPMVITSGLQVVAASLVMSAIDRHFRSGKLSLRSPWRLINNSVFPMTIGVIVMCVVSVVWRFVLFGLVVLVQVIADAAGFNAGVTLTIISLMAAVLFVLHVLMITPMLYWAPVMFMYGYKFRDAAGLSFKLLSGKKVFSGLLIPLLICAGIQLLIGFLNVHTVVACVCNGIIFFIINVYITVYVILTFYRISDLDRRDVLPYQLSLPQAQTSAAKPSKTEKPADAARDERTADDGERVKSAKSAAKKGADRSASAQKQKSASDGSDGARERRSEKPSGKNNAAASENGKRDGSADRGGKRNAGKKRERRGEGGDGV